MIIGSMDHPDRDMIGEIESFARTAASRILVCGPASDPRRHRAAWAEGGWPYCLDVFRRSRRGLDESPSGPLYAFPRSQLLHSTEHSIHSRTAAGRAASGCRALHLDIGHANLQTPYNTTEEILAAYGSRLQHVHLHDNKGGHADLHMPLGSGTVDVRDSVRALRRCGYDGTITLEVFTPDKHFLQYSRDLLRQIWNEAYV
jgi:hypothetical protein